MPIPQESILQESAVSMTEPSAKNPAAPAANEAAPAPAKTLSPAAQRALAEAEARRAAIDAHAAELGRAKELNGRGGLEPVRYDDWEVKGIASDF
jgi:hypothetical protein